MDIREIPIRELKGKSVGLFGVMNGGKTRRVVGELGRAEHSGFTSRAYTSSRTEREVNSLMIDNSHPFPAQSKELIEEIQKDLEGVVVEGEEVAAGIDEINLFCGNEFEAKKVIEFIHWCGEKGIPLYMAGLLYDFRRREFGKVASILPYINIKEEIKPVCKGWRRGRHCGIPANHSQRVWSREFAEQEGFNQIEESGYFNFYDKEGKLWKHEYFPAPFFDKTIRTREDVDESAKKGIMYLPVCNQCGRLPFREEVFTVYSNIIKGKKVKDSDLNHRIVDFLVEEKWVKRKKKKLEAIPFYASECGGFSEK